MYKLFLCLRYLLYRRIAIVPVLAVMLCVAMDLIVTGVMGGFLDTYRSSARGLFGDVIISEGSLPGFGYYDQYTDADGKTHPGLLQYLDRLDVVEQATPQIETYAMLRLPDRNGFTKPVQVLGIRPEQYARVTHFQDSLYWQQRGRGGPASADEFAPPDELAAWAKRREQYDYERPPSLSSAPDVLTDGAPVAVKPLAELVGGGVEQPTGVIVGARVFWPTPDKQGYFPRQTLPPGREQVQLTFLPMYASGVIEQTPVMQPFYLVDTSLVNIPQIDSSVAYVPFDHLQALMEMGPSQGAVNGFLAPARATRVLVKVKAGVELDAAFPKIESAVQQWKHDRQELFKKLPERARPGAIFYEPFDVKAQVWERANADFFQAIAYQRSLSLLMVTLVSLTVVALIWVIFIMIVVEKTKDIGIIKSVGGSAWGVAQIFLAWSAVIGAIGAVLGGLLGWLFIVRINTINQWLTATFGLEIYDPRVYLFDRIPARFDWTEMLLIGGGAIVAAMLGALLPAVRAGRMNPVEALRYE